MNLVQRVSPHARVDLARAHTAVTVDVFDGTACLAVLPQWHRRRGYNLRAVAESAGAEAGLAAAVAEANSAGGPAS